jgi:hypothetical protein
VFLCGNIISVFCFFGGGGATGAILSEKKKGPIIAELPLEQIRRPLLRTRNNNPEKVQQLMDSIADIGLQEPVSLMDIHYSPNNFVRIFFDWVAMVVYVLANWLSEWKYWRGGWEVKWTFKSYNCAGDWIIERDLVFWMRFLYSVNWKFQDKKLKIFMAVKLLPGSFYSCWYTFSAVSKILEFPKYRKSCEHL